MITELLLLKHAKENADAKNNVITKTPTTEVLHIHPECALINDPHLKAVIRLTTETNNTNSTTPSGFSVYVSRKMDVLSSIISKTFKNMRLKMRVDIIILECNEEVRFYHIYASSIITRVIWAMISGNNLKPKPSEPENATSTHELTHGLEVTLLSKYDNFTIVNPTLDEIELTGNYFYMVKRNEILYMEGFKHDIEAGMYQ